jgi:hypothetical protein
MCFWTVSNVLDSKKLRNHNVSETGPVTEISSFQGTQLCSFYTILTFYLLISPPP